MLKKTNEAIISEIQLLGADGNPATGKTVTAQVYDEAYGAFSTPAVTEIGSTGIYKATFTPDTAGLWTIVFDCADPNTTRTGSYFVQDSITTDIGSILTDTNELQTDWTNGGRLDLLLDSVIANIGNFQGRTNQKTILAALGLPDTSGKDLYTVLITDRLDSATFGLDALHTHIAAIPTTAMRGTDNAALAATALSNAVWTDAKAGYLTGNVALASSFGTIVNTGGTASLGAILGDFANVTLVTKLTNAQTELNKIGTIVNAGGTATIGAIFGDFANVTLVSRIAAIPTTAMRGTDGAALAVNYTATRAGYLDNINQAGLLQVTATRAGYLDNLSGGAVALAASWTSTRAGYVDNINQAGLLQVTATRAGYLDNLSAGAVSLATSDAVPSADATTDTLMRDVIGRKTDTANLTVGTQSSLMRYTKGLLNDVAAVHVHVGTIETNIGTPLNTGGSATLSAVLGDFNNTALISRIVTIDGMFDVPTADTTDDVTVRDVVGRKTDTANLTVGNTSSLMRYMKGALNDIAAVHVHVAAIPTNPTLSTMWTDAKAGYLTGDSYVRLGAPLGASVSADILSLENKLKTAPSVESILFETGGAAIPHGMSIWNALGDGTHSITEIYHFLLGYLDQAVKTTSDPLFNTLHLLDVGTVYDLVLQSDSTTAFTADRILTIDLDNVAKTLKMQGNLTVELASILNQDLTTDANVQFSQITGNHLHLAGLIDGVTTLSASGQISTIGATAGISWSNRETTANTWIWYAMDTGAILNYNGGLDCIKVGITGLLSILGGKIELTAVAENNIKFYDGTVSDYIGMAHAADQLVTGSVQGDLVIRAGNTSIIFSNGVTEEMRLSNTGNLTVVGYQAFSKTTTANPVANTTVTGTIFNFQGGNQAYQLGIGISGKIWMKAYDGYLWYYDNANATLTQTMSLDNVGNLTVAGSCTLGAAGLLFSGVNQKIFMSGTTMYIAVAGVSNGISLDASGNVVNAGDFTVNGQVYFPNLASADDLNDLEVINNIKIKDNGNLDMDSVPTRFKGGNMGALVGLLIGSVKQLNKKLEEMRDN